MGPLGPFSMEKYSFNYYDLKRINNYRNYFGYKIRD